MKKRRVGRELLVLVSFVEIRIPNKQHTGSVARNTI